MSMRAAAAASWGGASGDVDSRESDPRLVFPAEGFRLPAIELLVNFGPFAGREATPAEIDDLARELLAKVGHISIVSERHYEIGHDAEGAVHQVRIEVGSDAVPPDTSDLAEFRGRLIEVTERWARACIDARHHELGEP